MVLKTPNKTDKSSWTLPNGEVVRFPAGLRQEAALRLVEPGRALLDAGCGRGAVAAALAERFGEVYGLDADEQSLAVAARRGVQTARLDLDREPLPFPEARFDAVLSLEVIEHVRDPAAYIRELARVLEPGGRLYVSTPNVRFLGYSGQLLLRGRFPLTSLDQDGWQGGHIHFFTSADLEQLLRASGFDEVVDHGVTLSSTRRSLRFRALSALLGERLTRELLLVGIFSVARRSAEPVRAPAPAPRELRAD